jgi:hypothetical protein
MNGVYTVFAVASARCGQYALGGVVNIPQRLLWHCPMEGYTLGECHVFTQVHAYYRYVMQVIMRY